MWLLVLVMIGVDNPNIMTLPLEKYETEEVCYDKLVELEIKAQDESGQAALVCLKDPRVAEPGNERKLFDEGILNAEGKNVVVIGGGDTAMDCVRTSIRQKAKSVKCLYRRDRENMPGSAREVGNAIEEGVEFIWLTSPKSFVGDKKIKAVEVNKMKLGEPDSSGRRKPEIEDGSEYKIPADLVIKSLGFDPENIPKLFNAEELAISQWGTVKIDLKSMQTNLDGVFAAGDMRRGQSLIVWAIAEGRSVAAGVDKYLMGDTDLPRPV